ncbi:DUF2752 domain-containing protein [Flavobacterium sp.]|uniref:DUF2752 domain-containing protein n=1 Tax=Flavobacterium sp. TaxID=239 RepID=UPI002489C377|nr:DUF2752 domain-containing protein [Flavobacterium sp.]MDI1318421.1 DUF2752 domain-containing protein [Flavobacterium sp.]
MIPFFLMLNDKNNQLKNDQSLCPIKMLTGFPCPSCGITKSIVSIYKGNLIESIGYHILGPITVVFCFLIIGLLSFEILTKKEYFNNYIYSRKLAYGLAIFIGVYHVIRLVYFIHEHSFQEILKESLWK